METVPLEVWKCLMAWAPTPEPFACWSLVCQNSAKAMRAVINQKADESAVFEGRMWGWAHYIAPSWRGLLHGTRGVYDPSLNFFRVLVFRRGQPAGIRFTLDANGKRVANQSREFDLKHFPIRREVTDFEVEELLSPNIRRQIYKVVADHVKTRARLLSSHGHNHSRNN